MTTVTRLASEEIRHEVLRDLVLRWAVALREVARRLRARMAGISAAGQLGPGREVEVGRWTGARV